MNIHKSVWHTQKKSNKIDKINLDTWYKKQKKNFVNKIQQKYKYKSNGLKKIIKPNSLSKNRKISKNSQIILP